MVYDSTCINREEETTVVKNIFSTEPEDLFFVGTDFSGKNLEQKCESSIPLEVIAHSLEYSTPFSIHRHERKFFAPQTVFNNFRILLDHEYKTEDIVESNGKMSKNGEYLNQEHLTGTLSKLLVRNDEVKTVIPSQGQYVCKTEWIEHGSEKFEKQLERLALSFGFTHAHTPLMHYNYIFVLTCLSTFTKFIMIMIDILFIY